MADRSPFRGVDDGEALGYLDLDGLARYSGLSQRTLRRLMDDPTHPLPTHHVRGAGMGRGRVLISRREFDAWVATFPPMRSKSPHVKAALAPADPGVETWVRRLKP